MTEPKKLIEDQLQMTSEKKSHRKLETSKKGSLLEDDFVTFQIGENEKLIHPEGRGDEQSSPPSTIIIGTDLKRRRNQGCDDGDPLPIDMKHDHPSPVDEEEVMLEEDVIFPLK